MAIPSLAKDLILAAVPAGGQKGARRNAWAAMSADSARARARREADAAMARSLAACADRGPGTGS